MSIKGDTIQKTNAEFETRREAENSSPNDSIALYVKNAATPSAISVDRNETRRVEYVGGRCGCGAEDEDECEGCG